MSLYIVECLNWLISIRIGLTQICTVSGDLNLRSEHTCWQKTELKKNVAKINICKKLKMLIFFSQYEKLKWEAFVWDIVCWIWLKIIWNILLGVPSRVKNPSLYIFFFSATRPIGRVITHKYLSVFVEQIAIKVGFTAYWINDFCHMYIYIIF